MSLSVRGNRQLRGTTLIEIMASLVVFSVGVLGLMSALVVSSQQNQTASKHTRAMAVARDVLASVSRWPYDDSRLTNVSLSNDANVSESELELTTANDGPYDMDLNSYHYSYDGGYQAPVSPAKLDFNGDGVADYDRFITVAPLKSGTDTIGKSITVIVRWRENLGYRKVVLTSAKYDPSQNLANVPGL